MMKQGPALIIALTAAVGLSLPGHAATYAITGGTVYTLDEAGKIERGTVLIKDGKIVAVGADVPIPEEAERVDATGKIVTPGIFDPESRFGIVEIEHVAQTRDDVPPRGPHSAAFDVVQAINPRSVLIPANRIAGVTRAMVAPGSSSGGHVISGRGAIIDLGATRGSIQRDSAAMFAVLGEAGARLAGGSRAAALAALRDALQDARNYAQDRPGAPQSRRATTLSVPDLDALQPVLAGEEPLVVRVDRASDIRALVNMTRESGIKLVVSGGAEAWMLADELAAAHVPVLLDPLQNLPARFEMLGATLANAARLQKAGVRIAFTTPRTHNARNLAQAAGNAVANGLPWIDALKALMLNPAQIYGVDDSLGSLVAGKTADVVIWNADPLQLSSAPEQVFIAGRKISMRSRETLLRDRYLEEGRKNRLRSRKADEPRQGRLDPPSATEPDRALRWANAISIRAAKNGR